MDRDQLGRLVHSAGNEYAILNGDAPTRWEELHGYQQERARFIGAAIAAEVVTHPDDPPRYGHLALLGRREIGLCRVEPARMGGATMLRCVVLTADPPRVHWTQSTAIYEFEEITEAEAQTELTAYRERKERERKASEERARREAEAGAARSERRAQARARVTVRERGVAVQIEGFRAGASISEPMPELLDEHHAEVDAALRACDLDGCDMAHLFENGRRCGRVFRIARERVADVGALLAKLGFHDVERMPDENTDHASDNPDDHASDDEDIPF